MKLTERMKKDYVKLFNFLFLEIKELYAELDIIVANISKNRNVYEKVQQEVGCEWWFIGIIHQMESGLNFSTHLHNGDSLSKRTVNYPPGRPVKGEPPFSWEESAVDALVERRMNITKFSPVETVLYELERYNGFGYRGRDINSPYLWGRTNHHTVGKFTADGKFNPTAKTKQIGAAAIVRRFAELGVYKPYLEPEVPIINFDPNTFHREVEQLQIFLNKVSPLKLRVDGIAGEKTNSSFFEVFKKNLPGKENHEEHN